MEVHRSSVPINGQLPELRRAMHESLDAWAPGEVLMHSPRHVRTRVRVLLVPIEVDLLADGPDVHPMPDRRLVRVLPRQHWVPELEGAMFFTRPAGRGTRMVYEWWVHHDGPLPRPLTRLIGRLLADTIIRFAAASVERLAHANRR